MTSIDRITPTQRPHARPDGFQKWRDLLFLHWEVDATRLQSKLPSGLTVDCFEGQAYLGVVPFAMHAVRPWSWVPGWGAFRFLECNLRTYVYYDGQPGVYFLSLDAASPLAVWGARTFWGLPYYHARMRMNRHDQIEYNTVRGNGSGLHHSRYRVGSELGVSQPGSIEHFLLERYLLFVSRRGGIQVGQVHHSPYVAFEVELLECNDHLKTAAGFADVTGPPLLQHYSPGVDVEIFGLKTLSRAAVSRSR